MARVARRGRGPKGALTARVRGGAPAKRRRSARAAKKKNPEKLLPWERFGKPPSYKAAHWGLGPREVRTREVGEPSDNEELVALGELEEAVYITAKGSREKVSWVHRFGRPRPLLCYGSEDGRLYLVGGSYKVTRRGIVH